MFAFVAGYEYELFVSYCAGEQPAAGGSVQLGKSGYWVREVFYPELERAMREEHPNFRMFFDKKVIPVGSVWPEELKRALHVSRCMLAIWSVPYFQSAWCRSEWHTMLARQRYLRDQGHAPGELVFPISYWDGDHYDDEAKACQSCRDWKPYNALRTENIGTQQHLEFRSKVQDLCGELVRFAATAPLWDDGWPQANMPGLTPATIPLPRHP